MIKVYFVNVFKNQELLRRRLRYLKDFDYGRVIKALRPEKKMEYIASGLLKQFVFEKELKKSYPDDISLNEFGKPVLKDNSFNFSFSGNLQYVVACVSKTSMLGVDVECKRTAPKFVSTIFFTENEWNYLAEHSKDFSRLWTRKEAFLKCIGTGWNQRVDCDILQNQLCYNGCEYCWMELSLFENIDVSICYEYRGVNEDIDVYEITDADFNLQ